MIYLHPTPNNETVINNIFNINGNVNGDVNIYVDNRQMVVQNFGNELIPNIYQFIEMIYESMNDSKQIDGDEILNILFTIVYILTEENRSLIIKSPNDGRIDVRTDNDWVTKARKDIVESLTDTMKKKTEHILNIIEKYGAIENKQKSKRIRENYNAYIACDYNERKLFSKLMNSLINNRDILKEYQLLTKTIPTIELVGVEKNKANCNKINEYIIEENKKRIIYKKDNNEDVKII